MPSITGELPSRWGISGNEDLGGGYRARFVLESGFNVDNGTSGQGGRLFGRQSWVGIETPYGTVSFGRQYTMTYQTVLSTDILGPNIYGMGSFDAYIANARSDNAVVYRKELDGFSVGASYSFGRDSTGTGNSPGQGTCAGEVAGEMTQCRLWSAMLAYDGGQGGGAVSYEEQRGGSGAAASFFNGVRPLVLTSAQDKDNRTVVNGYVTMNGVKVVVGWIGRWVDADSSGGPNIHSNLLYLSVSYLIVPTFTLDGGVYHVIVSGQDTRATLGVLRGTYSLSKRTAVYLQGAYLTNSSHASYSVSAGGGGTTPAPGQGQIGVMAGVRQSF